MAEQVPKLLLFCASAKSSRQLYKLSLLGHSSPHVFLTRHRINI